MIAISINHHFVYRDLSHLLVNCQHCLENDLSHINANHSFDNSNKNYIVLSHFHYFKLKKSKNFCL